MFEEIILIMTIYVTMAIGAGVFASEKRRGGIHWFFLGLLWGPIALIVIACLPEKLPGRKLIRLYQSNELDAAKDHMHRLNSEAMAGYVYKIYPADDIHNYPRYALRQETTAITE